MWCVGLLNDIKLNFRLRFNTRNAIQHTCQILWSNLYFYHGSSLKHMLNVTYSADTYIFVQNQNDIWMTIHLMAHFPITFSILTQNK